MPDSNNRRGVSTAPAAMTTCRASMLRVAPSGPMTSTPVARRPSVRTSRHERLGHQLGVPCGHGARQQGDGVPLGVDGTPEERAEAAVVTGGAAVIGDGVGRGGSRIGMQAQVLGRGARQHRAVHRRAGRHGIGARAPRRERVGACFARHADRPLGLRVVRLEVVVGERPVRHLGSVDGAAGAQECEVLLTKTRHLAVRVRPTPAHGGGDGIDLTHIGPVALLFAATERARLDEGIGPEEVPVKELELVVGVVGRRLRQVVRVEEVIAALLDDHHGPSRAREHVRGGGATRPRPHDDGVDGHGPATSASLHPRGWTSPRYSMASHPSPSRLPPYSGAPYMPSQQCS